MFHKTFTFQVKAVNDEQGLIEAYGSVFNNVDQGDDIVRPGAFKRTINNSKSRVNAGKAKYLATMLWNHDTEHFLPIGGWYDLKEDKNGLLSKGQIVLATQLGKDVYELIKSGVINEFSIGYDIPTGGALWNSELGARELKELRLWEISPVVFAMNQEALLVGVKKNVMTEKKDFSDRYRDQCIRDWRYSDFDNLMCALQQSVMDIFAIGDEPQADTVNTVLDGDNGFISAIKAYVQKGIDLDVSGYLSDLQQNNSPSYNGYMRSNINMEAKAGRAISTANADQIQAHIDAMHGMADKCMKDMSSVLKEHTKAMHSAADDLATILQGSESAYGTDPGTPASGEKPAKAAPHNNATGTTPHSSTDTAEEEALAKALVELQSIRK